MEEVIAVMQKGETMSDYVSRQAAIDALGENRPDVWTDDDYELGMKNQFESDVAIIEALPTADVIDTSRCMDCKYYRRW